MTAEPPRRVFYRLVQTDPPTIRDFLSHEALGIAPKRPLSRREQDLWRGVSHHNSLEAALSKGSESPWLGRFVAEVRIPADKIIRVEQTGRDLSHHTLWADAATLLYWAVIVIPIEPVH